ncbi:MAG: catalase [Pseudonocardiales bacterium]|nr:catalase [Pseudonocardiales bacterium]
MLDRNPENYFAQIEQAAFEPANLVAGTGPSPDKMLQGRLFAYPDAHRYRIGANYTQLPVNAAKSPVNSYSKDGAMRYQNIPDPVYAPNSYGGPHANPAIAGETAAAYGVEDEVIRSAYKLHAEDDDFGQPGTMVRKVFNDEQRERFVGNVAGHLRNDVSEPILERAFQYWKNVDKETGDKIEQAVRSGGPAYEK